MKKLLLWLTHVFLVLSAVSVLATAASAADLPLGPSFDCEAVQHPIEKLICSDERLSRLDRELSALYRQEITEADSPELRKAQRKWVKERRNRSRQLIWVVSGMYYERIWGLRNQRNLRLLSGQDKSSPWLPFFTPPIGYIHKALDEKEGEFMQLAKQGAVDCEAQAQTAAQSVVAELKPRIENMLRGACLLGLFRAGKIDQIERAIQTLKGDAQVWAGALLSEIGRADLWRWNAKPGEACLDENAEKLERLTDLLLPKLDVNAPSGYKYPGWFVGSLYISGLYTYTLPSYRDGGMTFDPRSCRLLVSRTARISLKMLRQGIDPYIFFETDGGHYRLLRLGDLDLLAEVLKVGATWPDWKAFWDAEGKARVLATVPDKAMLPVLEAGGFVLDAAGYRRVLKIIDSYFRESDPVPPEDVVEYFRNRAVISAPNP